jgi:uncharacterized protein
VITAKMRRIIEENTIGLVATVTPDGSPGVSPKGTTVVLDDKHVVFSNIRSPQTVANIRINPVVELNFIDVFRRKACRLKGTAIYCPRGEPRCEELLPHFLRWDTLVDRMRGFVVVEVTGSQLLLSPIYDVGGSPPQGDQGHTCRDRT